MKRYQILLLLLVCFLPNYLCSQEFDISVSVNSNRINSVDNAAIKDLQTKLQDFINSKSWTNAKFEPYERIKGSIVINLSSYDGVGTYNAELNVKINRPVYNSSYTTTTLNFRDKDFVFSFSPSQIINYSEISANDNLTATIVFYLYTILGLDADSFALNGGKLYYDKALKIANDQQLSISKGWENYTGTSRTNLIYDLTNSNLADFHTLWYNYHRGLDEMSINTNRGKIKVLSTLDLLENLDKAKRNNLLITIFAESKLSEFLEICAIEDLSERKEISQRLQKLYPGRKSMIDNVLNKQY